MIMILRSSMLNSSHMIHFVRDHREDLSLMLFICRGQSMKSSLQRLLQKKERSFCKPQMQTLCNSLSSHHLLHCASHRLLTLLLLVRILLAFITMFSLTMCWVEILVFVPNLAVYKGLSHCEVW